MSLGTESYGKKLELKLALFKALFTDGLVMDDKSVLAQIAESVGLDRVLALNVLRSNKMSEKVSSAEQYWINTGVQAVPAFIINQKHLISGAQDPGVLADALLNIDSSKEKTLTHAILSAAEKTTNP